MSAVATAIIGGAVIGGAVSSRSSSKAAKATTRAGRRQAAELKEGREAAARLAQPFVDVGTDAAGQLQSFLQDPNQQLEQINPIVGFLRDQGFEQIQESAAAQGRLGAGGTLKDLSEFNQNLSATIAPQLQQQRFNQLFSVAGLGSNAAAGQGTAALNTGANLATVAGGVGQANAQNALSQGAALNNTISNIAGVAGAFPSLFGGGQPSPATATNTALQSGAFGTPTPPPPVNAGGVF